jgi:hypothetical protein
MRAWPASLSAGGEALLPPNTAGGWGSPQRACTCTHHVDGAAESRDDVAGRRGHAHKLLAQHFCAGHDKLRSFHATSAIPIPLAPPAPHCAGGHCRVAQPRSLNSHAGQPRASRTTHPLAPPPPLSQQLCHAYISLVTKCRVALKFEEFVIKGLPTSIFIINRRYAAAQRGGEALCRGWNLKRAAPSWRGCFQPHARDTPGGGRAGSCEACTACCRRLTQLPPCSNVGKVCGEPGQVAGD